MTSLSQAQYAAFIIPGIITSTLSIIGSSLIMLSVLWRKKLHDTLHQFLFGLSVSDIINSFCLATAAFAMPRDGKMGGEIIDPTLAPWAVGNKNTCAASAFLFFFSSMSTAFYNNFISIHYWRFIQSAHKMTVRGPNQKWTKIAAHTTAISIPLLMCILPIILSEHPFIINTYPGMCFNNPNPWGRIRAGILTLLGLMSIGFTVSLRRKVRADLRRSTRYGDNPELERRERKVAAQALWYLLAYLNSFLPNLVLVVYKVIVDTNGNEGSPGSFAVLFLTYLLVPLQGALNFLVFVRPRYLTWKQLLAKEERRAQKQQMEGQSNNNGEAGQQEETEKMSSFKLFRTTLYKALFEEMPVSLRNKRRARTGPAQSQQSILNDSAMQFSFPNSQRLITSFWASGQESGSHPLPFANNLSGPAKSNLDLASNTNENSTNCAHIMHSTTTDVDTKELEDIQEKGSQPSPFPNHQSGPMKLSQKPQPASDQHKNAEEIHTSNTNGDTTKCKHKVDSIAIDVDAAELRDLQENNVRLLPVSDNLIGSMTMPQMTQPLSEQLVTTANNGDHTLSSNGNSTTCSSIAHSIVRDANTEDLEGCGISLKLVDGEEHHTSSTTNADSTNYKPVAHGIVRDMDAK